jgi:serine phosphatase RsbU (regulator of sigma subunit)
MDSHFRLSVRKFTGVTLMLGLADPKDGSIAYAGTGACYPFLLVPGKAVEVLPLPPGGLGGASHVEFENQTVMVPRFSRLAVCTDGVLHARNLRGDAFGELRCAELLVNVQGLDGSELGSYIFHSLDAFADFAPVEDDQTVLSLDFGPEPEPAKEEAGT